VAAENALHTFDNEFTEVCNRRYQHAKERGEEPPFGLVRC
jgi:hypothetical protein